MRARYGKGAGLHLNRKLLLMESNKILGADILDIVFEGRNKEYGAYELRKSYNRRLGRAMAVTGSLIGLLFLSGFVVGHTGKKAKMPMDAGDPTLTAVDMTPPPPPPPPPPAPPAPQVKTMIFTPPKIVPNDQTDAPPPENAELENAKIGTVNAAGGDDVGITGPPASDGDRGVVEKPKQDEADKEFVKIEKESEFPGGAAAWLRYLNKNLRTPDDAIINEITGTVVVKFMVDPDGNVSDVEAVSGPENGGLREEAVRVIKKSGKWTPALQNGRYVRSYKQQPITFVLMTQ